MIKLEYKNERLVGFYVYLCLTSAAAFVLTMSEGTDKPSVTPVQINNELNSGDTEPLQVLKPSLAPGASAAINMEKPSDCQSRQGLFRVLAGLSPGIHYDSTYSSTTTQLADYAMSSVASTFPCRGSASDVIARGGLGNTLSAASYPGNVTPARLSEDSRSNMAAPYVIPARLSEDSRLNMAAPSQINNNMFMLLHEQYKQQQSAIDKLTEAVQDIVRGQGGASADYDSDSSELQTVQSHYDQISSDDDMSDTELDRTHLIRKRKLPVDSGFSTDISEHRLKKMKAVESQFVKEEEFGPSVHAVIASTVNKGLSEPVDHKSPAVQELLSKYHRPESCDFLQVPLVNKLLWSSRQTNKDLKQADRAMQRTQGYMTTGMMPLIQIMNKTLSMASAEAGELFDLSLDAFNLLAYAHRDLSSHRRRLLSPAISTRYAALCSDSEKFSSPSHLFGDDKELEKRLKEIDDSQKLGKNLTPFTRHKTQVPASSKWPTKERPTRPAVTVTRDFLGKRAPGHYRSGAVQPHHRWGNKKEHQGFKKNKGHQRQ